MGFLSKRLPKKINFLSLVIISFLFIAIFSANLSAWYGNELGYYENIGPKNTLGAATETESLNVIKTPAYSGAEVIDIQAKSVYAIDVKSGAVLYDKNSTGAVMPASTVKVVTSLVALDSYNLHQFLSVGDIASEGQRVGLVENEKLTVEDLLYALLLSSANDAAEVLAANYPGGRDMFISAMNIKAQNLGLRSSVFFNPTGLDKEGQQTTAQDMVKASFYAMQHPVFRQIVGTQKYTIYGTDGKITRSFYNINQLLGKIDGVKGIKTGKTDGAMENLLTYIERDNMEVIIGLFGSNDRFGESEKLIDWIFANYSI